jgi:glycosyltransferase involved in cell wall biosynthesis
VKTTRIAQLTGYFDPSYYSSNELFLCKGLTKLGCSVTVFTSSRQPKWQTIKREWKKNAVEYIDGFIIRRLPSGLDIGAIQIMPTLLPKLMKEEFDIVHSHDFFTTFSFYGAFVANTRGIPFVLTQHNDQYPSALLNCVLYEANALTIGRYVLQSASKIIALTKDIKQHLIQFGVSKKKIEIIPNAVDTEKFSPEKRNLLQERWGITSPVVLFVGRLSIEKDVCTLLRAFSNVVKEIPKAKLVIIGKGSEEMNLKRFLELNSIPHVFFLGKVENSMIPNIYAGADVFVLPSTREPFGNVVLEAMASGKPVIGSFVGGMKEVIVDGVTGYHAEPRNDRQFSELILRILVDSGLKEELGANARQRAENHYDKDLIMKRITRIYRECARKN